MAISPPTARPDPSTAVTRIALQVGATAVAHVDVGTMLTGVCAALPPAVGVAGAVLVLTEPPDPRDPQAQQVFASDDAAGRLGLIQQRAGRGPVPAAVRGDRPLTVPDLTVSGPPELAAAAADCGLVRSLVVPVPVGGQPAGGLQLLAGADTTLDERTAAVLWPLVSALSARLADARELARLATAPAARPDDVDPADPDALPPETTAMTTATAAGEPVDGGPQQAGGHPQVPGPDDTARLRPAAPGHGPVAGQETRPADASTDGPAGDPDDEARAGAMTTVRDPLRDLFADGEPVDETPPAGQAGLGWDGPEHTPAPTPLPSRLPARVPVLGRSPRPVPRPVPRPIPATVPAQRSGPAAGPDPLADPLAGRTAADPLDQAGTGLQVADLRAADPLPADPLAADTRPADTRPGDTTTADTTTAALVTSEPVTDVPEPGTDVVAAAPGPHAPDPGSGDGDLDGPTWRVPRHRLRDDG